MSAFRCYPDRTICFNELVILPLLWSLVLSARKEEERQQRQDTEPVKVCSKVREKNKRHLLNTSRQ